MIHTLHLTGVMRVRPSTLFKKCYGNYALAAINVWSMEQILALFKAAQESKAPFMVQMTPVAIKYSHLEMLLSMINAAEKLYPEALFAIHLDHGNGEAVHEAISCGGFSSVMIDASHESYERNVSITKGVVEMAGAVGVEVEAELGVLSGVEDDLMVENESSRYTRPDEVVDFVSRTGCDSLAIAIGTSHGAYKFSGKQALQFNILHEIQNLLPEYPLVLHGGSAINSEEVNRINAYGGKLGSGARGVPLQELKKAITYGICKVNIATDARLIWTRVHREHFMNSPENFDPLPPGKIYMSELENLYREKFEFLGATNKTGDF
jgi:fructose-bisphosphate aldolase class II